jgi:rare lipoprotein A
MRRLGTILLLGLAATLAACATPTPQPSAPPSPATAEQPTFHQEGTASWYGSFHQGQRTANGETFDMESMTAAHRTLRFGTVVRVTNLSNGKMVKVRINDRGPYAGKRIIDLSAHAGRDLGMTDKGTTRVKIEAYPSDQGMKDFAPPGS